jgi:hypothetical protein
MERIIGFVLVGWVIVMAIGVVIALLPLLAFVAGFLGMVLIFAVLGRWLASVFS